jgi:hypothetical protein
MTTTAIFRDFKQNRLWKNKYLRGSVLQIRNANLFHGDVRPFACPEKLCECVGPIKTLYPLDECECFGFDDCRDIVKGFCKNQYFFIEEGNLKQATETELCNGDTPCMAGAPVDMQPPTTTVAGCADSCDKTNVAYVITRVTEHAGVRVESAPSPVSNLAPSNGDIPNVPVFIPPMPEGYCIAETRLYRTEASFEDGTDAVNPTNAEFVLVATLPSTYSGPFIDNIPSADTGYPLTTYDPMAFPAPMGELVSVVRTEDGIAVADDCRVYISLPGQPQFTWDGVVEVEDNIQRLAAVGNTIFVFTDGYPVKIGYRHTDGAMTIDRQVIQRKLPLCSCESVSVYGDRVYFATTHSLYQWDIAGYGADIKPVLTDLITPDQWKNLKPETVRGTAFEFGYILSSDSIDYSLMFGLPQTTSNSTADTFVMPIDYINADAFTTDAKGHIIYRECNHVYKWDWRICGCDEGFDITDNLVQPLIDRCECCPWTLTLYIDNEGKNRFSKMRVEFDERSGPVDATFSIKQFGDDSPIDVFQIVRSRGFPIPGYCSGQTFCVELTGCSILHEVRLATSYQELSYDSNTQLETA